MKHKSFTLKLDEELYSALTSLESVVHRSVDQIITDALSMYVNQKSGATEKDLENTLRRVQQYAAKDPKFEHAITAFVDAEIQYEDPVEGTPVTSVKSAAQAEIREIIDGV